MFRLSANTALFYIRDLSIHEFSYALGFWNQILEDTEDNCNIFVKIDPRGKSISRYAGHGSTHLLNLAFTFKEWGFPGGPVAKNPPANAGDMSSIPGPGRLHRAWSS